MIKIDPKKYPVLADKPLEQWHKDMWEWLAQNPRKTKQDYVDTIFPENERKLLERSWNCFACMFADRHKKYSDEVYNDSCRFCPICNFGNFGLSCCHGLYDRYKEAAERKDYKEVSKIATQISNLEWRVK